MILFRFAQLFAGLGMLVWLVRMLSDYVGKRRLSGKRK